MECGTSAETYTNPVCWKCNNRVFDTLSSWMFKNKDITKNDLNMIEKLNDRDTKCIADFLNNLKLN